MNMQVRRWYQHAVSFLGLILFVILAFGSVDNSGESGDSTRITRPRGSSSTQWFQGGNLHKATVAEWKNASYQNKLATAADWLASTKWKGHLMSPDDFDRLKLKAQMLVNAVDEVVTVEHTDSLQVTEIAGAIITMSNDLGP